jgi:hypothetical protein
MDGARVITHHSSSTIVSTAAEVAAYVLDPTTMPEWSAVIYEVEPPTETTFQTGSRLRGSMHILGVSLTVEGEMLEFDLPGRRAAIAVRPVGTEGLLEHELYVEDLGNSSVVHFNNRLTLPAWLPTEIVSDELIRHLFDQTSSFALANIKYILESHSEAGIRSFGELVRGYLNGPAGTLP